MNHNGSKVVCIRNHPLSGENLAVYDYGRGTQRLCVRCNRMHARARKRRLAGLPPITEGETR